MATIDSASIIKSILENEGVYCDGDESDPPATGVWKYFSALKNGETFSVYWNGAVLQESGSVRNPVLLWDGQQLTKEGEEWLKTQ